MSQRLFRFAVIADSHVNPSDRDLISPYESHRMTNQRMTHTVNVLNALAPAFTMHVGDMIHPVPEAVSYPEAAARFFDTTRALEAPIHLVPGNHDVGDKLADYVPAGAIQDSYVELYRRHFGECWYSFSHEGCHFVVINTSLINSGLSAEREQTAWLEAELAAHAGQRIFLFIHYPPFIATPDEHGHYDNIDQPGRSWLLALIQRASIQAVFTGHVHNFFFNIHAGTPIFSLPSTAFVRADYAELFSVGQPPENENGRNDVSKLGVLVVDVFADRMVPQFIRTYDKASGTAPQVQKDWPLLAPAAQADFNSLGVDLRHNWADLRWIPYSSMLDEFGRKLARNDYPVLALWEMGIRKLRVPIADLEDCSTRERMDALAALGSRFTVFVFGLPNADQQTLLRDNAAALHALEVVLKWPLVADIGEQLMSVRRTVGVPLHVSRFWSASGQSRDGKQIKLLVDHGFSGPNDAALDDLILRTRGASPDGVVFRVSTETSTHEAIAAAADFAASKGLRAQVHVRLSSDSPAQARNDPATNGARTLTAAFASRSLPHADVFIDTLNDVDRGYFPRAGLVDGRFNPKREAQALRNLHGLLSERLPSQATHWHQTTDFLAGTAITPTTGLLLLLPLTQTPRVDFSALPLTTAAQLRASWDLCSGNSTTAWSDSETFILDGPCLFEFDMAAGDTDV